MRRCPGRQYAGCEGVRKTIMNENQTLKMLQETIGLSDDTAADIDMHENDIVVSASEEENKLFWSVEYQDKLSA